MNKINSFFIVLCVTVVIIASTASGIGKSDPYPYECSGVPSLREMIKNGMVVKLESSGSCNGNYEEWSTSQLKPENAPADPLLLSDQGQAGRLSISQDECICRYSAFSAMDDDPLTAWIEGTDGDGIGEIVVVKVNTLKQVEILSGVGLLEKQFKKYNRPRKIRIHVLQQKNSANNGQTVSHMELKILASKSVTLHDKNRYQPLPLPKHSPLPKQDTFIALEILSVYAGKKYKHTGFREVRNVQ